MIAAKRVLISPTVLETIRRRIRSSFGTACVDPCSHYVLRSRDPFGPLSDFIKRVLEFFHFIVGMGENRPYLIQNVTEDYAGKDYGHDSEDFFQFRYRDHVAIAY